MQYSIYVNQLFVAQHPECGDLDFTDLAIFDCIRKMLEGKWGDRKLVDGILWKNLRTTKVLEEMPLLRTSRDKPMSEETVRKRITKLCDAGLLQKDPSNKGSRSAFIALGSLADSYDKDPEIQTTVEFDHLNGQNLPSQRSNSTNYQSTDQNTLSKPIEAVSQGEPETKKKKVRKSKPTRLEVISFYDNEKLNGLKTPLPPGLVAAAAAGWKLTEEKLMERLEAGYAEIVDYMMNPSDMWPNGMWRCVLTKPDQLEFSQFCKLILQFGMTRDEIKANLNSWENKQYPHNNIYATLYTWKSKPDSKQTGTYKNETGGIASVPKRGPKGD